MEDGENQQDDSEKGSRRSTLPLTMVPQSYAASETAPTRSPSVSFSGSGSHGEMRMDLPPTRAQSESPPVADNLGLVVTPSESSLPQVNIIPATPQSSQRVAGSHVVPPISVRTTPSSNLIIWVNGGAININAASKMGRHIASSSLAGICTNRGT